MRPYAERAPRTTRWEHYEHAADLRTPDDERLLAEWLNALAAQMTTRRLLFGR
ncbi:MAG TPA: hypothetical protein VFI86_06145 [Burkholderiales bacterium]|nr:hypothetical protein [Burkholderiales bacterium]